MDGTLQPVSHAHVDNGVTYGSLSSPHGLDAGNDLDHDDKKVQVQVREEWSEEATDAVLDIWGEKHLAINRGKLKKHEWDEVAEKVTSRLGAGKHTKTWLQCKNKIDSIKKKYKIVRNQKHTGILKKDWRLYEKVDALLGPWPRLAGNGGPGDGRMDDSGEEDGEDGGDDELEHAIARQNYEENLRHAHAQAQAQAHALAQVQAQAQQAAMVAASLQPENDVVRKSLPGSNFEMAHMGASSGDRINLKKRKLEVHPMTDLAKAIRDFSGVYAAIEREKIEKQMEMEKMKMEFAKELEVQRIQLQLDLAKVSASKQMPGPSLFGQE
eukprot:jgi/Mesen1/462/ME000101S10693